MNAAKTTLTKAMVSQSGINVAQASVGVMNAAKYAVTAANTLKAVGIVTAVAAPTAMMLIPKKAA